MITPSFHNLTLQLEQEGAQKGQVATGGNQILCLVMIWSPRTRQNSYKNSALHCCCSCWNWRLICGAGCVNLASVSYNLRKLRLLHTEHILLKVSIWSVGFFWFWQLYVALITAWIGFSAFWPVFAMKSPFKSLA